MIIAKKSQLCFDRHITNCFASTSTFLWPEHVRPYAARNPYTAKTPAEHNDKSQRGTKTSFTSNGVPCRQSWQTTVGTAWHNTTTYDKERLRCMPVLAGKHKKYVAKLKEQMRNLKKNSKRWWQLNRELLHQKAKTSSIPPLRQEAQWVTDSKGKAELLAKTFASKAKLPPEVCLRQK